MKIQFYNSSYLPLRTVAKFAVPKNKIPRHKFRLIDPHGNFVQPCFYESTGISDIYTLQYTFSSRYSTFEVNLDEEVKPLYEEGDEFNFHKVLTEAPMNVVPSFEFTNTFGDTILVTPFDMEFHIQNINAHLIECELDSKEIFGIRVGLRMTAEASSNIVRFSAHAIPWDTNSPTYFGPNITKIRMLCKENFEISFGTDMGIPFPKFDEMEGVFSTTLYQGNLNSRQGQGLFQIHGVVTTDGLGTNPDEFVANNMALFGDHFHDVAEVVGIADFFDSEGFTYNYLPKPEILDDDKFEFPIQLRSIHSPRKIGIGKYPGQTGAAEDFGSYKLLSIFNGDPRNIINARAGMVDYLRPFHLYNKFGNDPTKWSNSNLTTWSLEVFDRTSVDLLGKDKDTLRPVGTGWMSYDNQHRSLNNLFYLYALTGDTDLYDIVHKIVSRDQTQAQTAALREREVGRMLDFWYKAKTICYWHTDDLITELITKLNNTWRGRFVQGPIKLLQVEKDSRSQIINPYTKKIEPIWLPYQTSEMMRGLYAVSLIESLNDTTKNTILSIMSHLAITLLYGYTDGEEEGDEPRVYSFLRYRTGLDSGALPHPNQAGPEEGMPVDYEPWEYQLGNAGLWHWYGPALAIGLKLGFYDEKQKEKVSQTLKKVYPSKIVDENILSWYPLNINEILGYA